MSIKKYFGKSIKNIWKIKNNTPPLHSKTNYYATTKITPTEIMSIGKAFAESGMFPDIKSAAQAVVKIQAGSQMGMAPFASMSGIHIISGTPTIGAGIMASMVKGSGKYNYKVVEQTEKVCSIDYYEGKELIGNSTFTIEDAKKAAQRTWTNSPGICFLPVQCQMVLSGTLPMYLPAPFTFLKKWSK
jgi:hypothetical protein